MGTILKLEARRIFFNKKNICILLLIAVFSICMVFQGIWAYKGFAATQKAFQEFEKSKVQRYSNWDQYGGMGFEVLLKPSPLAIFFCNSSLFDNLATNIDSQEIIKVYSSRKGISLFKKGQFKDLAGVLTLLGSLLMLFMGLYNFKTDRFGKYYYKGRMILSSVFSRLLWLNLFFLLIIFVSFVIVRLNGIVLTFLQLKNLATYGLYLVVFLTVFYALGLLITCIFKSHRTIAALALWFVFLFIIPELNNIFLLRDAANLPPAEALNISKLEELKKYEDGVKEKLLVLLKNEIEREEIRDFYHENALTYLHNGYVANQKRELEYAKQMRQLITLDQKRVAFIPFVFHNYFATEISSQGYGAYIDFIEYIRGLRDKFFRYYLKNRYEKFGKEIESFVKSDENLFQAESRLPGNYHIGLSVTVLYSLILLGLSFFVLRRRMNKIPEDVKLPELAFQKGHSYLLFFKDAVHRDLTFENYIRKENVSGIDRVEVQDIDSEINPKAAVKLLSSIRGTKEREILEYLEIMGVSPRQLETEPHTPELLRKMYVAFHITGKEIIVINEFLKDLPRSFETDFLKLVRELKAKGKIFVYLSVELPKVGVEVVEGIYRNGGDYSVSELDIENLSFI